MTKKRYLLRTKEAPWKTIDKEEGIVLRLKDGIYYSLNPVALKIWELSDGTRGIEDITLEIEREYDVSFKKVTKDVEDFVDALKREELVLESPMPFKE